MLAIASITAPIFILIAPGQQLPAVPDRVLELLAQASVARSLLSSVLGPLG